jgi:hypothetical protein
MLACEIVKERKTYIEIVPNSSGYDYHQQGNPASSQ